MMPPRLSCPVLASPLALALSLACLSPLSKGESFKVDPGRKGTAAISDAEASGKKAAAIQVEADSGKISLGGPSKPLPPGLYRIVPRMRLQLPSDYDASRLRVTFSTLQDGAVLDAQPAGWNQFDSTQGRYTSFERLVSLPKGGLVSFEFAWAATPLPPGEKPRAMRPLKGPTIDDAQSKGKAGGPKNLSKDKDDLAAEIQSEIQVTASSIDYPAVFLDEVDVRAVSTGVAVERVWPAKVHVYPGEENPVEVTLRNYHATPQQTVLRLEMRTGLEEAPAPLEAALTVPAGGTLTHSFPWKNAGREFGHEARATLLVGNQEIHRRSEYFSVGEPIWKTALQADGFLSWMGREDSLPGHVEHSRTGYANVEEAFSWQPSSWTDLNPTSEEWWTGQGNAHNNKRGLRLWMELNHRNGIKMITYSWPTASGPAGVEWGRKHPELISHSRVGLSSEFHDVEDLKLSALLQGTPAFKRLQYGVWHGFGIDRGRLETIELGAREIIQSSRTFGWDGVRFDSPPGWGSVESAEIHEDFERFGVTELARKLLPEFYETRTGRWSGFAVSARNVRWMRHQFHTQIEKPFAVSFNFGADEREKRKQSDGGDFFHECAREGSQMMNEAIRLSNGWEVYRKTALMQAQATRELGAFSTVFCPNKAPGWARQFAAIFTFAAGSHPYGNYGSGPQMAGTYNQFMTRFGEFCWDLSLAPLTSPDGEFRVENDKPLLWQDYVTRRTLPDGSRQTVVHLITPPPADAVAPAPRNPTQPSVPPMPKWSRNVKVHAKCRNTPEVWLLSAEPATRAEKLPVSHTGDTFTVTLPEHRFWSLLVWTEKHN